MESYLVTKTYSPLLKNQLSYGFAGQYTCSAKSNEKEREAAFVPNVTYFKLLVILFIFCFLLLLFSPALNCICQFFAQVLLK